MMNDERNSKKSSSSSSMMDISTYGSITQNLFDAMNGLDIGSWKYKHQSIDSSFDDPDDHEEIDFKSGDDDNDDDEYDENSSKPNETNLVDKLHSYIRASTDYIDQQVRPMQGYKEVVQPKVKNKVVVDSAIDDDPPPTSLKDQELEELYETLRLRKEHSIGDEMHPKIIQTLLNIGQVLFDKKDYAKAKITLFEAFEKLSDCKKLSSEEKDLMLKKMATGLYETAASYIENEQLNEAARSFGQALDCYHLAGLQDCEAYKLASKALSDLGSSYDKEYDDVNI